MTEPAEPSGREPIAGVTLDAYATVRAGLRDGVGLAELLAFEGIEATDWPPAERGWRERLLTPDEAEGLALSMELDRLGDEARKHWVRRVPPLDEDLRLWLDFVRLSSAAPDPLRFFEEHGVVPSDVVFLHRLWAGRLAATPALQQEVLTILAQPPGDVPRATPEPARIATRREGRRTDDDADRTRLPVGPGALATLPFEEAPEPAAPAPGLRVPIPRPPRPERTGVTGVDETSFLRTIPDSITLPFWEVQAPLVDVAGPEGGTPTAPSAPEAARVGIPPPPAISMSRTDEDDPLEQLTFFTVQQGQSVVLGTLGAPASAAPEPPMAPESASRDDADETLFLRVAPDAASLPFGPPPRRERPADDPDATAPPMAPGRPAVPFVSEAGGDPLQRAKLHALVTQGPARPKPDAADETAVPAAKLEDPTLPFSKAVREEDAASGTAIGGIPTLGSAMPFAEPGGGPALTLEQYASLCVDIELAPLSRQETIARYGLGAEGWRAEDDAWKKRIAAAPELRTSFERARAVHRQWRGA